jgi:hypothetical protein
MKTENQILLEEIISLLRGGNAHLSFQVAVKNVPMDKIGIKLDHTPYSLWQLVEHIRIAQWDMLQFCINPKHLSPPWPEGYWPVNCKPFRNEDWFNSIDKIQSDLEEFILYISKNNLFTPLDHGSGQNLLREAFQIADHTSYHSGEIVALRRILDAWAG